MTAKNSELLSILIIHFHSSKNAGDAAQLEAAITDLHKSFPDAKIVISANYPQERLFQSLLVDVSPSISSLIRLNAEQSLIKLIIELLKAGLLILKSCLFSRSGADQTSTGDPWLELIDTYRNSDMVLSTPGNIFITRGRVGFLSSALSIVPALCFGKPFYVLPQSIGPLHRWWERSIVRYLYSQARLVFLREPFSLRTAVDLGLPEEVLVLTHDQSIIPASAKAQAPPRILQEVSFDPNAPAIGVTVIPDFVNIIQPDVLDNYYRTMAESLCRFIETHHARLYFFPQVTGPARHEDDREAARLIVDRMMPLGDRITLIEDELSAPELKECYQWMDIFVATRLHSAIFSMSNHVPTLMLEYLDKTRGAAELFEWQEYAINIAELSESALTNKLESLWNNREDLKPIIRDRIDTLIQTNPKAAEVIREDYEHVHR
ncbi:MAG: polysaccharide pyruvyl transferase family protein [Candidatus Hermodarchaeia archaeon]|jgi:colanic acid/amylovoran biosynthesis protein